MELFVEGFVLQASLILAPAHWRLLFSTIWFFGLAVLLCESQPIFDQSAHDASYITVSGIVLLSLAVKLSFDVWSWI